MKIPPKLLGFTFLLLSATLASASIAGWLIDGDTHLIAQDPFTGKLKHTFCNHTINMPSTLSFEDATDLTTDTKPKNGTSLAGVGWFDGTVTWASIIYQDEHDDLMYARYNCSLTCGSSDPVQQGNISSLLPAGVKVHPYTGIAAVRLKDPSFMRAYFLDDNRAIHEISYQDREGWQYEGSLPGESASGNALVAAANDAGDVFVVSADDEHTVNVFEQQPPKTWTSAPLSLPNLASAPQAWKPKGPQTALHVDTDGTVSLFYIDKDNHLQQLTSAATNRTTWAVEDRQPERIWPVAHPENTELVIAAHRELSSFWMYYHGSDKRLSELSYNAGT